LSRPRKGIVRRKYRPLRPKKKGKKGERRKGLPQDFTPPRKEVPLARDFED